MPTAIFAKRVASEVRKSAGNKQSTWYTPFMAAASRAVSERIPLVDFVLDVRDARIPLSSECEHLRRLSSSSRRIVVLNKVDLAKRSSVKDWIRKFEQENLSVFCVNSHNKSNIQEFLNFLQCQVRALKAEDPQRHTITLMLVSIPNVGKSALANSLHKIGRVSATEKGKLKHAAVSPVPGETKSINSLKVASHPNIYILDTPGILPPQIIDAEICAKLALTGALVDSSAGEKPLAQYFLSLLNLSGEYHKWEKLSTDEIPISDEDIKTSGYMDCFDLNRTINDEFSTDHTKDSVVLNVRRSLVKAITSFGGNLQHKEDMLRLIQAQFRALKHVFNVPLMSEEDADHIVAVKLLNLYRTGRLGHFTLDSIPVAVG